MFCLKCGKPLREGAAFCLYCGAPVAQAPAGMVCPACGSTTQEEMAFCGQCGSRLVRRPAQIPAPEPKPDSKEGDTPGEREASAGPSRELLSMKLISWYKGEAKVGIAKATGTLTVYTDRLELKKQLGGAMAALSPIALVASAANASKSPAEVFRMQDIVDAKEGKYGLAFPCLVITMRSGEKHTFVSNFDGEKIRESVELIHRYCGCR